MTVTETRSLPPKFVEDLGKDYATQLTGLTSQKMDTTKYQPMVAGQDQATQRAYNMATTQGQGIGSYAPYMAQAGALQGMGLNYLQRAQAQSGVQGQQLGLQGQQLGAQARQLGTVGQQIGAQRQQLGAVGQQLGAERQQLGAVGQQLGAQRQQLGAVGQQLQAQGAYSGPQAYQQFMSPYQQDVINASLGEFDKQAAKGMSGIGQMAAKSGNLGGGREGVMRSEFKSNSDMNRALLNAKLLQQGFGQANQLANQAFNQQGQLTQGQQNLFQGQGQLTDQERNMFAGQGRLTQGEQNLFQGQGQLTDQERNMFTGQGQLFSGQGQLVQGQQNLFNNQQNLMQGANTLGADQQRMAQLMPQLRGSDISTLGQAGRGQQLYNQSVLDQQREANRMAAYEPYERLGYMGAGMGNVMGGAMGQYQSQVTPNQSPLQQALGIASLGLGAYKGFQNRG